MRPAALTPAALTATGGAVRIAHALPDIRLAASVAWKVAAP